MPLIDDAAYISLETTPGTEKAVTAADAVHVRELKFNQNWETMPRNVLTPSTDTPVPHAPHVKHQSGTIELEWKAGSAVDAVHPELDKFLEAAGFTGVEDTGVKYQYKMDQYPSAVASMASVTLRKEEGPAGLGKEKVAAGVLFGNVVFSGGMDQPLIVKADWVGQYKRPADDGTLTVPVFASQSPLTKISTTAGSLAVHTVGVVCRRWSCALGYVVTARPSLGAPSTGGYHELPLMAFSTAPVWILEFEAVNEATFAAYAKKELATSGAIKVAYSDGSRSVAFDTPVSVITDLDDATGVPNMYTATLSSHGDGTDMPFMITLT